MNDKERRKELVREQKQIRPAAGVYRIVNTQTGKTYLGSTLNLDSLRNKFKFAQSTNSPGALDYRLRDDIKKYGLAVFSLEILEVLEVRAEVTVAEIQADLAALEELWREKMDAALLY